MLVALLVFSMLLGRNRLAGWLWFVVPAAGFVAFAVGLFWINLTPPTPMHSQGTKPPIRLQIITEISRNLLIKSGFLILVLAASFAVTQALGMQEDIFSCLTYMLLICFAAVYLILAYGFYNLRPWAYTPVKHLLKFDWLGSAKGSRLHERIQEPEVKDAFGSGKDLHA